MKLKDLLLTEAKVPLPEDLGDIVDDCMEKYYDKKMEEYDDAIINTKREDLNGRMPGFIPFYDYGAFTSSLTTANNLLSSGNIPTILEDTINKWYKDAEEMAEEEGKVEDEKDEYIDEYLDEITIYFGITVMLYKDDKELVVLSTIEDDYGRLIVDDAKIEEIINLENIVSDESFENEEFKDEELETIKKELQKAFEKTIKLFD